MSWFLYALASAIAYTGVIFISKISLHKIDSLWLITFQSIIMTAILIAIVTSNKYYHNQITSISLNECIPVLLGGTLSALSWIFYFEALKTGLLSHVVAISLLSYVFAFIVSFAILGEICTTRVGIGITLLTTGIYLISV